MRSSAETGLCTAAEDVTRYLLAEMGPDDVVLVDSWVSAAPMSDYARRHGAGWVTLDNRDHVRYVRRPAAVNVPDRSQDGAIWVVVNAEGGGPGLSALVASLPEPTRSALSFERVLERPGLAVHRAFVR